MCAPFLQRGVGLLTDIGVRKNIPALRRLFRRSQKYSGAQKNNSAFSEIFRRSASFEAAT